MSDFDDKTVRLLRQLNRHRERFIRAWCAHYRVAPEVLPQVQIVTRFELNGEVMHMEWNPRTDLVKALVRAAGLAADRLEDEGLWHSAEELRDALVPFTREDKS